MTFNNNIRKNSYGPTDLPKLQEKAPLKNADGSVDRIQAIGMTTEAVLTNTHHATESGSSNSSRYTFSFFNSKTEQFPIRTIDRLASLNIVPERRLIALRQIADEATVSMKEITTTIEELEAKVEASQEKEMGIHVISRFRALGETLQAISVQSQESAANAAPEQEKFADVVDNLKMHERMADNFSLKFNQLSNEFINLLRNPKGLSTQERARWKNLVKEERSLYGQMKTQIKTIAKCIDITDTQIEIGTSDDARTVRARLVHAQNSILHTLRQADQNRFSYPPTEHVADMIEGCMVEGYQNYMEQHDSLMQRTKNLQEDLLFLTRNRHSAEKKVVSRGMQPEQEVTQAKKQKLEGANFT